MKRSEKKWCFYIHHLLKEDMFYVGITSNQKNRFYNGGYRNNSLYPYLDLNIPFKQNPNIETECTEPLYTYEEAVYIEEWFITAFKSGKCINKLHSGLHRTKSPYSYSHKYLKKYYHSHYEEIKERSYIRQCKPENKIYSRVHGYNRTHTPIETPLEAKQRYLSEGYIPLYVKHDDLLHVDTVVQR